MNCPGCPFADDSPYHTCCNLKTPCKTLPGKGKKGNKKENNEH